MRKIIFLLFIYSTISTSCQSNKENKKILVSNYENTGISVFSSQRFIGEKKKMSKIISVQGIGYAKYEGHREAKIIGKELNAAFSFDVKKNGKVYNYYYPMRLQQKDDRDYTKNIFPKQGKPLKLKFYYTIYNEDGKYLCVIDNVTLENSK